MKHRYSKRLVRREEITDEGNRYSYELTVREGNTTADWRLPLYSIKIRMTDINGKNFEASAKDVFANESCAMEFFEKILRNLATPIDLAYIVEDELTV